MSLLPPHPIFMMETQRDFSTEALRLTQLTTIDNRVVLIYIHIQVGTKRCAKIMIENYFIDFVGSQSAHNSRVDLSNIGRPPTAGSVIYLGRTNSSNTGSRLSLVSRSSSLSSPQSSPKHRPRQ